MQQGVELSTTHLVIEARNRRKGGQSDIQLVMVMPGSKERYLLKGLMTLSFGYVYKYIVVKVR